jgi:hypothetical protein
MEKEFVPYILALEMKSIGFDEPCFGFYYLYKDENHQEGKFDYRGELNIEYSIYKENTYYILAPTYSQAFRFFREKYGWISKVWTICISTDGITSFEYAIDTLNDLGVSQYRENFPYKTYEEAELACLKELIEIVKEK